MNPRLRIKICCIANAHEAQMAIDAGADALGLVGHMPSGPGVIPDRQIQTIARYVPPPIATFLLTSETNAQEIIAHYRRTETSVIQLVDALPEEEYLALRQALPAVKLVQVIHVVGESSLEQALYLEGQVDALLLDSGNPHGAVKELGGTGRTHNWQVSRKIVEQTSLPVFLAGGLNAQNVAQAVETVQPYGLDLCSSLRQGNELIPEKLEAFMQAVEAM